MAEFDLSRVIDYKNMDNIEIGNYVLIGDNVAELRDQVEGVIEGSIYVLDFKDVYTFETHSLKDESQANRVPYLYALSEEEIGRRERKLMSPQDFLEHFRYNRILLRVEGRPGEAMEVLQVKTELDDACVFFADGLELKRYTIKQLDEEGFLWCNSGDDIWHDFSEED